MIKSIIITVVFVLALYFGSGGFIVLENEQKYEKAIALQKKEVVYKRITFYNKEVMEAAKQQNLIQKFYAYYDQLPSVLNFIITALCFGIIGSIGKVVNDTIKNETILAEKTNLLLIPCQGAIIGLIILGVSYTIPVLLTSENVTLKPITVVFLSLFSGIFYENFYQWFLKNLNENVFKD
jgi:hypothetical protein